jgi:hypothetical protein
MEAAGALHGDVESSIASGSQTAAMAQIHPVISVPTTTTTTTSSLHFQAPQCALRQSHHRDGAPAEVAGEEVRVRVGVREGVGEEAAAVRVVGSWPA